jgi:parallel beta-helix repeat protein
MWVTSVFGSDLYVDWQQQSGPYKDIQSAILAAVPGDVIHVSDGTYPGNLLVQEAITIISENGPGKTIIDCAGSGVGVTFKGAETTGAVLSGFTITGGNADLGGAIFCELNASPTISDCVLSANKAVNGGAIACSQASPIISHCTLEGNTASSLGGGLYVKNTSPTDPSPTLMGCTIANNSANKGGGVYLVNYASPAFYNCLIAGNSAVLNGGGLYLYNRCAPDIIHCTVSDNTSGASGSGIFCYYSPDPYFPVVTNSIVWGNAATTGAEICLSNALLDITFSAFNPGVENSNLQVLGATSSVREEGNIYEDPAFIGEGDYHLSPDSPCIDSGTDQIELPEFDIEGEPRIVGSAPDMGADEFVPEVRVIQVEIDIKPESTENKINLKSWGLLAVAVKATEDFDARSIDPSTVVFAGATPVWRICYDVDRDGDKDMLFLFRVQKLVELNEDSTQATLTGMTKDGKSFEGTDSVTIIKPKGKALGFRFGRR